MNIDNLRQLLDEATPGPWFFTGDIETVGITIASDPYAALDRASESWPSDANLIVALRNAAPDLLAAVEALERLTDATGPIAEDDGPDHIFAPTDHEWQEFEAALADARAVLRRLRGEEGDR